MPRQRISAGGIERGWSPDGQSAQARPGGRLYSYVDEMPSAMARPRPAPRRSRLCLLEPVGHVRELLLALKGDPGRSGSVPARRAVTMIR